MATTSFSHLWKYDAFVSFRGEDIRKSFMDHLFKDFKQKGIHAFRDDNQLPRGEEIPAQLYQAITESRFLIVIFSKNYASSSWCLRELVKILECKQTGKHKHQVRIIFYDVKPAVVRNQTGSYAEAFAKHEFSNATEVAKWKEALSMAANLSGWDLQDMANGYESKFIDNISNEILEKLGDGLVHVGENLVGVYDQVNKMNLLRYVGSSKVHMIGICGIGGIGKTTLAKAIYNLMYIHFENCIFCEDVQGVTKQHGLAQVIMQLIDDIIRTREIKILNIGQAIMVMKRRMASRRILLVLDAVDHSNQLEALAGSPDWFFPGSLIIFTSKDKQLLSSHKVNEIYDMGFLDDTEALELFSLYAFSEKHPTEDFKELADQVVKYVQGHPLALKVLGRFLFGKTVAAWKSELDKLQIYPNAEIQQVLRLSFDGLDFRQQRIFLDIACSLKGENKDLAVSVLDSCNFFADTNIRVLVDKSLVTISSTMSLQMHDLIQTMAREIVREESNRIGERSRLWIASEVCDVLKKDKVTEAVEVVVLLLEESSQQVHIDAKAFARMSNLRILKIYDPELEKFDQAFELKQPNDSKVNFSGRLEFLSNELRLLYWHRYPFKLLPSEFYPENIVAIDMSYSHIKNLWTATKCFKHLKVMKLKHCRNLTNTPNFTEITNLEELILEGCVNLVQVHPSIGMLKRLVVLNMRNCRRLRSFPCKVEMDSLQVLILSGCVNVDKIPEVLGMFDTLLELHLDRTSIKELPSFVFSLSNLQVFSIGRSREIQSRWWPSFLQRKLHHPPSLVLPSFTGLRLLRHLDVSHCNISEFSPGSIGGLSCLDHLNLSGNNFVSLPEDLSQLSRLTLLGLVGCKKLQVFPELPPNIIYCDAINCTSLCEFQKQPVMCNRDRHVLDFTNCPKLVENHTIESLVSMFLPQEQSCLPNDLIVTLQGSRIPRWFTNQSTGNRVKVELPPGWYSNKFRGYATCVVFTPINPCSRQRGYGMVAFDVLNSEGVLLQNASFYMETYFPDETIGIIPDLIVLRYLKAIRKWEKANNFVTFLFHGNEHVEVKCCGVRLVFEENIQEASTSRMIQDYPVFHPNQEQISETTKDEPPIKKTRFV